MSGPAETVLMGEVDRFVMPAGEAGIARFCAERLLAPHNARERLRRALLLALPAEAAPRLLLERTWPLRLGAAGDPAPAASGAAPRVGASGPQAYSAALHANGSGRPAHEAGRRGSALDLVAAALGLDGLLDSLPLLHDRPVRWLLVEDYPGRERERLVLFLFAAGEESPAAVLKIRRSAGPELPLGRGEQAAARPAEARTADPPLAREERALSRLGGELPADLSASVPRPLAYRAAAGLEALLISPLPGISAYAEMQGLLAPGRAVERHFELAAGWLARFHRATRLPARTLDAGWEAESLVTQLARRGLRCDLSWQGELERALAGSPLALSAGHGDFWARNLLVGGDGEAAGVVDWEHAADAAPPWEDLFQFPLAYGLNYPWKRWRRLPPRQAFARTFLADNRLSRAVARYLRRYAGEAELPLAALAPLFHLHLLTRSLGATRGAGGEEETPWIDFHRMLAAAGRSVFSG